jgi:hypothetical protein
MTERQSVTNVLRDEYRKASKKQKSKMLDEFCKITGYNRNYASRKLRSKKETRSYKKIKTTLQKTRGRKRRYGPECIGPLIKVWTVLDLACGKRVKAAMNDTLDALIRFDEITVTKEVEAKLRKMSASTIDRLLSVQRKKMCLKGRSTTKPGTLLKHDIPIRTGTEWPEGKPGFVEMDTVAHCGTSTKGQYVVTLDVTDIETGWTEQRACFNKAQTHVFAEVKEIRARFPFDLLGIDTDGGGEFINDQMYRFCMEEEILFTRGRAYKKNDGCHIEEKNWSIVRRTIGYGRFETQRECDLLNMIYDYLRLLTNFFMPSQKLIFKKRDGAKVIRKLDDPKTPYKRILDSDQADEKYKKQLVAVYKTINPAECRRQVIRLTEELYKLSGELRGPQDKLCDKDRHLAAAK